MAGSNMKKTIIVIVVAILIIAIFISWVIVNGRDLNSLKEVTADWEATIRITEDRLEGYADENVKTTIYELKGEDVILLKELLLDKTLCRRRFEQGGYTILKAESRKEISIIIQDNTDKDFQMELSQKEMILIDSISHNYLKNLNKDFEEEILMFLSNYDPVKEEIN